LTIGILCLIIGLVVGSLLNASPKEKHLTKCMMWSGDSYRSVGMWCSQIENETYICKEYHDGWIPERCEIIEKCNNK